MGKEGTAGKLATPVCNPCFRPTFYSDVFGAILTFLVTWRVQDVVLESICLGPAK